MCALRVVVVSRHARVWLTMHYSCICQARVHTNELREKHACSCEPKCTSAVPANHDAYSSRLMSRVYTHAPDLQFYITDLPCTHRGYFACIFKNVSSCVVASHVCSQV